MTTFSEDRSSVEGSIRREGYRINAGYKVFKLCPHDEDITINGEKYLRSTIGRGELGVSSLTGAKELAFTLPVAHELVQRWMAKSTPPRRVEVKFYQSQQTSGEYIQLWSGFITAAALQGDRQELIKFSVTSLLGLALVRRLPTVSVSEVCAHMLYDEQCSVVRTDFEITTTVTAINGLRITVASMFTRPDGWANLGEFLHVPTNERMPITGHVGLDITVQAPIFGLSTTSPNNQIKIYAGCYRSASVCTNKFGNIVNFGGFPDMPTGEIFVPGGQGVLLLS